jgi:hypothetical protein
MIGLDSSVGVLRTFSDSDIDDDAAFLAFFEELFVFLSRGDDGVNPDGSFKAVGVEVLELFENVDVHTELVEVERFLELIETVFVDGVILQVDFVEHVFGFLDCFEELDGTVVGDEIESDRQDF